MQKWEYCTLTTDDRGFCRLRLYTLNQGVIESKNKLDEMIFVLPRLGEEGWEMVSVHASGQAGSLMWFQRPKQ